MSEFENNFLMKWLIKYNLREEDFLVNYKNFQELLQQRHPQCKKVQGKALLFANEYIVF